MSTQKTCTESDKNHEAQIRPHPSAADFEYVALNRHNRALYEQYSRLPEDQRHLHKSNHVFRSTILGGIASLRLTRNLGSGEPDPKQIGSVQSLLDEYVSYCTLSRRNPRELLEAILEWSWELYRLNRYDEALACSGKAMAFRISDYPDLHARLLYLQARIHFGLGKMKEAVELLSPLVEKYYLIPDRELVPKMTGLLAMASVLAGDVSRYKSLLLGGLWFYYRSPHVRISLTRKLATAYGSPLRLLLNPQVSVSDKTLFFIHAIHYFIQKGRFLSRIRISKISRLAVLSSVYVLPNSLSSRSKIRLLQARSAARTRDNTKAILITRAMGGVGDLLMMTPGLHALKSKFPEHEIHLAIPERFHALFEGNPDVKTVNIENIPLDCTAYEKWFNLTDCPAARYESRTAPRVKKTRITLFARAMGISDRKLAESGKEPRYFLSAEERLFQKEFWNRNMLEGRKVVGVQLHPAESYRDYPYMQDVVERLALRYFLILFYSEDRHVPAGENIVDPGRLPIRKAFALASGCSAIVGPDSAFGHLSAALGIPSVLLSGPVDGIVRSADYPLCTNLDSRAAFNCIPCWRNELTPCKLTGLMESACMRGIGVDDICRALGNITGANSSSTDA